MSQCANSISRFGCSWHLFGSCSEHSTKQPDDLIIRDIECGVANRPLKGEAIGHHSGLQAWHGEDTRFTRYLQGRVLNCRSVSVQMHVHHVGVRRIGDDAHLRELRGGERFGN